MPDKDERWIAIYEMVVHPARARGRPPAPISLGSLELLLAAVKLAAAKDEPIKDEQDQRGRYLFLQDMEISTAATAAAFVWTLGNLAASAPVLHRVIGNRLRTVAMQPGESVAVSAHMVIDLHDPKNAMRYGVGLEDIDGISRSRVENLLERELRKLVTVSADVGGREKEGEPVVTFDSVPGPLMGESGKRPMEIELLKLTPRRGLTAAAVPYYEEAKREYVFRADPSAPLDRLLAVLPTTVQDLMRQHPDHKVRVRWKTPGETREQVTQIDPTQRAEALLERALTSSACITDLGFEMPGAVPTVDSRLVKRILEVLRSSYN